MPDDLFKDGNGNRGAKVKYPRDKVAEDIKRIPLMSRGKVRRLSQELKIPPTTIMRLKKEGVIRSYRSSIKPKLTVENVNWRLDYAWTKVDDECFANTHNTRDSDVLYYDKCYNDIHVDEKWFYLIKEGKRFYLAHDEEEPYITQQHKGTMPKVMFLCALGRPRYVPELRAMWDGKIGIWPIGYYKPAERSSANRPAGTLEWQSVKVDRVEYRNMMICKVLPAIIEKWPTDVYSGRPITIQQDGAKPHFVVKDGVCIDKEWNDALEEYGLEDKIMLSDSNTNVNSMIIRRVSLFYQYPLEASHHMVCPCTLDGVCVVCPDTSELVGQHPPPISISASENGDCQP